MGLLNTTARADQAGPVEPGRAVRPASASITLQSAAGLSCSGHAGVCFKPPTGQGFEDMQAEVVKLLAMDGAGGLRKAEDSYGYHWLVVEDADIEALVTQIHMVNSSLADAGWGPQLLCSVFGLARLPAVRTPAPIRRERRRPRRRTADPAGLAPVLAPRGVTFGSDAGAHRRPRSVLPSTSYLVYLFKRGTFYPFVPEGHEQRDIEQELKLKSLVADDLVIEPDLDRWFPLWDLPVG